MQPIFAFFCLKTHNYMIYLLWMVSKMEKKKKRNIKKEIKYELKHHKKAFIVYFVLRFLILVTLVLQLIRGNYEHAFYCVLTLILFLIPGFIERKFNIEMPETLEIVVFLFVFAAEILGEMQNFFNLFSHWDTILHTINGFLCAAIGFSLIDILNRTEKFHLNLSPLFVAIVGFCFSMTIGVLWEFFEYGVDVYFKTDMQKDTIVESISSVSLNESGENVAIHVDDITSSTITTSDNTTYVINDGYLDIGLIDTMEDLAVNFIGAVIYCVIGFFYVKNRDKDSIASKFLMRIKEE